MDIIQSSLTFFGTSCIKRDEISVVTVGNQKEGLILANNILQKIIDSKTILFLSGGRTPKDLYISLAKEKKITPSAVALIDERYGEKFHENSNEKMIQDSGFISYLGGKNIRVFPILEGKDINQTAKDYDEEVRYFLHGFPKSVAILGIGLDGHTAGLPANPRLWQAGIAENSKSKLVVAYDDSEGFYKKRITMTFSGLSLLSILIVLVFGEDKKEALSKLFMQGSEEEIPGRFFKRKDIAPKTLFITDQKV